MEARDHVSVPFLLVFAILSALIAAGVSGCRKGYVAEDALSSTAGPDKLVAEEDAYVTQKLQTKEHHEARQWLTSIKARSNPCMAKYVEFLYGAGAERVDLFVRREMPHAIVVTLPADPGKRQKVLAIGAEINGVAGFGDAPIPDKGQKYLYLDLYLPLDW